METFTNIIIPLLTIFAGGGWFLTYKAYRKKADGEADQSVAEAWKAQQDVYQQTINDLKVSCEYIKSDRDLLREENKTLRAENNELREKYNELEKQIIELRKELCRQEQKIERMSPFTCAMAGCGTRTMVRFQDEEEKNTNDEHS